MRQASDIKSALSDAQNELKRHVRDTQTAAGKADRLGKSDIDKTWEADHLQRMKDSVKNLQKQSDFVQKARSSVDTGKSPLASPMTKFVRK